MTYHELVDAVRAAYAKADASEIKEHIAFQFNIEGEGEGAFYLEIADGKINIEPYEYYDRDVIFTTKAKTLLKIGTGKLDPIVAFTIGKLKVEGDIDKALVLKKITPKSVDMEEIQAAVSANTAEEGESVQEDAPQTEDTKEDVCGKEAGSDEACDKEDSEDTGEDAETESEADIEDESCDGETDIDEACDEEDSEDTEEDAETESEADAEDESCDGKSPDVKTAASAKEPGSDFAKKRQNRKIKKKRR